MHVNMQIPEVSEPALRRIRARGVRSVKDTIRMLLGGHPVREPGPEGWASVAHELATLLHVALTRADAGRAGGLPREALRRVAERIALLVRTVPGLEEEVRAHGGLRAHGGEPPFGVSGERAGEPV